MINVGSWHRGFSKPVGLGGLLVALILLVFSTVFVTGLLAQGPVGPDISIVSPSDGFATNQDVIQVEVHFQATANPNDKKQKPTGNVKTVILKIDDTQVARHDNPPQV